MTAVFDTTATQLLVDALRHKHGLNIEGAREALAARAHPNTRLLNLTQPELDGFPFSALAYAASTNLALGYTTTDRLALLHDLVDRGADRAQATALLLAVYSDLWESHPRTARRMVIGLHTLHTALEPYLAGNRSLPGRGRVDAPPAVPSPSDRDLSAEIPFE